MAAMTTFISSLLLLLLLVAPSIAHSKDDLSLLLHLPLSRLPFLRTHDSATGYLSPRFKPLRPGSSLITRWTATQNCTLTQQLDCGARVLDFRPMLRDGKLIMHHGPVPVEVSVSRLAKEIAAWAGKHRKQTDLVLVDIWDCVGGEGCLRGVMSAFRTHGIRVYSCKELINISIGQALRKARLWGGGYVLAYACHRPPPGWVTYDPKITCQGFQSDEDRLSVADCLQKYSMDLAKSIHAYSEDPALVEQAVGECSDLARNKTYKYYSCYDHSSSQLYPYKKLMYFDRNLTSLPPPDGWLYEIMGAWAENVESVILGFLRGSSLIDDEKRSSLNKNLVKFVVGKNFQYLPNMLGVNNVCNGGNRLLAALRHEFLSQYSRIAAQETPLS